MPQSRLGLAQFALAYGTVFVTLAALDGVWLGWLALGFYQHEMGSLMADPIRIVSAALYYLFYPLAMVYLVLMRMPASLGEALRRCAVFGLAAFGVYDLTNLSVLRGYSALLGLYALPCGT